MNVAQDLRFAIRQIAAKPLLFALAIVSLALGVGVNSSIFSIVNAILFRGVPAKDADRLVAVYTSGSDGMPYAPSSYPDFRDLREQNSVLKGLAAYSAFIAAFETPTGTQPLFGQVVTGNFFALLGVRPAVGRSFLPEEDQAGSAHPVVMLGYGFWKKQFAGDPSVVGRILSLNGTALTIVGVTPPDLASTFPGLKAEFWLPMQENDLLSEEKVLDARGHRSFFLTGRLRDGTSIAQSRAQLETVAARLAGQYPETNKGRKVTLVPWRNVTLNPHVDGALFGSAGLLLALVALVLLIASSNIANLLLARANDRRKEITLRLAVGASRRRLMRQLLTESLVLALCSGTLGLLIALATTRLLVNFKPPLPVPLSLDLGLDFRVLLFTLVLAVATGFVCGLAPAIQASKPDLAAILKDDSTGLGRTHRKFGLRNLLVVSQVAVSTLLLIDAGLFLRSLANAQSVNPGFSLRRGAVVDFSLGLGRKYSEEAGSNFLRQMVERVKALPGVHAVAVAGHLPLGVTVVSDKVEIEGKPVSEEKRPEVDWVQVGPGYFETLGIPLVQGRSFDAHDDHGASGVAIVNATAAKRFWPGDSAIGKRFKLGKNAAWLAVVGVAADGKYRSLGEEPLPFAYRPYLQSYSAAMTLIAATDANEKETLLAVRRELGTMDPNLPVFGYKTMTEHLGIMLFMARMGAWLLASFGLLGLILASIGLYGVVSYSVSKRTREVGVRMAIGATRQQILKLVLREGMALVLVGVALGIGLALAGSRLLTSVLFGISAQDPAAFLGVPLFLAAVAFLAIVIPARRATWIEPMAALRYE